MLQEVEVQTQELRQNSVELVQDIGHIFVVEDGTPVLLLRVRDVHGLHALAGLILAELFDIFDLLLVFEFIPATG